MLFGDEPARRMRALLSAIRKVRSIRMSKSSAFGGTHLKLGASLSVLKRDLGSQTSVSRLLWEIPEHSMLELRSGVNRDVRVPCQDRLCFLLFLSTLPPQWMESWRRQTAGLSRSAVGAIASSCWNY